MTRGPEMTKMETRTRISMTMVRITEDDIPANLDMAERLSLQSRPQRKAVSECSGSPRLAHG